MSDQLFRCRRYRASLDRSLICRACGESYESHIGTDAQARTDDPPTAKASAAALETNPVETNILEVLRDRELAGHEVAADPACRYPEITTSARLRPMARRGLIDDTGRTRTNPLTNRPCIIWTARRPYYGEATMTTKERVHEIVREELEYEGDFSDETTWDDLGADSLDVVDILCALEDSFAIDIPDKEAEGWENVGQAVAYLQGLEDVV